MSTIAFDKLPDPIQRALAYRAELEHFGWHAYAFIGYGATLTNVPLEVGGVGKLPGHTLITVHLRLPNIAEFVVVGGWISDLVWPAAEALSLAMTAWNLCSQDERTAIRKRIVTLDACSALVKALYARGIVSPKFAEQGLLPPQGSN